MNYKFAIPILAAFAPFITLGDDAKMKAATASDFAQMVPAKATSHDAGTLRLKVTCRSGAVVSLYNASLVEQGLRTEGSVPRSTAASASPVIRLDMPEAGTVTIPWDDIDRIEVGDRAPSEMTYAITVILKNGNESKKGKTYGNYNTVVGRSDDGEFSIELKDVKEIAVLSPSGAI